jgi:hypothetical protein
VYIKPVVVVVMMKRRVETELFDFKTVATVVVTSYDDDEKQQ